MLFSFPILRIDDPCQARLHAADQDADYRQGDAHHPGVPVETVFGEEIPVALDRLGGQIDQEKTEG